MATIYAKNKITGKFEKVGQGISATDSTLALQGIPADAKAVGDALGNITADVDKKMDKITGTSGDFVVIGADGSPTTKTLIVAEEVTF